MIDILVNAFQDRVNHTGNKVFNAYKKKRFWAPGPEGTDIRCSMPYGTLMLAIKLLCTKFGQDPFIFQAAKP